LRPCAFDFVEIKENRVVRDQLAESISAAMALQKGGKTVRSEGEHVAEKDDAKPTDDTGAFVKKAVEAGRPEARAMANQ
jgi:hypothetical protein